MHCRPPDVIVLVGGQGTRLQGVVRDRPKPLADVAGRPFLERLLLAVRAQGLQRVILATGYKGEMVEAYCGDGAWLGLELAYSCETAPLGTGGAARQALARVMTDRVLVLNGDSYCPFAVDRLLDVHRRAEAQATLWLVQMDDCRRYGSVEVAADGRVVAFSEKSPHPHRGLISAGVYLFERDALAAIAADRMVSLETEVFPALIDRGLFAAIGEGPFLDIGTPEAFRAAQLYFVEDTPLCHAVL